MEKEIMGREEQPAVSAFYIFAAYHSSNHRVIIGCVPSHGTSYPFELTDLTWPISPAL